MGWYTYIANQSGVAVKISLNFGTGPGQHFTVNAGENRSYGRGGMCLFDFSASGGGKWGYVNITTGMNTCQNWEFLIPPNFKISSNGYVHPPPGPIQQKYPPTDADFFVASPAGSLEYAEDRERAAALAERDDATNTETAIREGACFERIFGAYLAERGLDALVAHLKNGPPEWAYQALLYLPLDEAQRAALRSVAAKDPKWAFYTLRDTEGAQEQRDELSRTIAGDPKWAHHALRRRI